MKKISCPLCDEKFNNLDGLHSHIEEDHEDNIPEGYTVDRYMYYIKTGKTHGNCVICKNKTGWNNSTGKYKRFCENPKCKEKYRETFKNRMVGKYGKVTLLDEPEHQRKMLANRHISGEYEWTDGTKKTYTGSYELDFLKMLDVFMNFDSSDIMTPSPHTYYYTYEGEKKFYIPDVYIPSLNLEIEIKDGGDNPNKHSKIVNVDKAKERLKDSVMASQKSVEYIKIVNKNYDGFFKYLLDKKEKTANAENINLGAVIKESYSNLDVKLDNKDICLHIDEWTSGKQKTLIITGYCGSGKSTLTDKLARKYNARFISLDMFENYIWSGGETTDSYANDEYIVDFVKSHDILSQSKNCKQPDKVSAECVDAFIKYCISKATTENERIIIEGYQIYAYTDPKNWIGLPIIIMGTGYNKSAFQKTMRDVKAEHGLVRRFNMFKTSIISAYHYKDSDIDQMNNLKSTLGVTEGWFDAKVACIESPVDENPQISELLHNTLNTGHHIWVATDWHLWKCDKTTKEIYKSDRFDNIILNYKDCVNHNDVIIYLGDLVDDEFQDRDSLKETLKPLKGHKILIKGNNDLFDDAFYKECGFIHVGYKLLWEGILFSHMPIENDYRLNCHGHLHGGMTYKIKYTNQVDVYTDDGQPIDILEVIKRRKEYAEQITEVVDESYDVVYESKVKRVNNKGENIPETCPECGSKIGLYLRGEPVWVCSNKECDKCFGTLPCGVRESYEPVTEVSNKLRDLDQYFDFERFVNGDTNRLFITGLAGSSKMQLAKDLATAFNCEYINLDLFTKSTINMMINGEYYGGASREYVDSIIDFANKYIAIDPDNPNYVDMPTHENIVLFINNLIKNLNPNKRYVIEGVYIYRYYKDLRNIVSNESLIITQDSFKDTLKKFGMASMSATFSLIYDETDNPKSWYVNEKDTLNAFSKDILEYRSNTNNMKYNDSIYPVYVVLLHSGSAMSNIIKAFTGDEFSHACISFDPSLRNMMSFGKNQEIKGFQLGMTNENIQQSFYRRPIPFALYVTFVDVKAYIAMKKTAYKLLAKSKDMTYNFTGLVKYAMGLPAETANALFCSEFVATVLDSGGDLTDGLKPSEVKPESYKYMSKFQLVQKGVLTEYDMNETIRRVKMMKKK